MKSLKPEHGNVGNKNAAKAPKERKPRAPTVQVPGCVNRAAYCKAASKEGISLAEWGRQALEEKLKRATGPAD